MSNLFLCDFMPNRLLVEIRGFESLTYALRARSVTTNLSVFAVFANRVLASVAMREQCKKKLGTLAKLFIGGDKGIRPP